jgi:hypothetical protein
MGGWQVPRKDLVEERIAKLIDGFGRYVSAYDALVPFSSEQLAAHRECLALRREAGSVRAAASNMRFIESLRRTLVAWGIGGRASYLVPPREFTAAIHTAVPTLEQLEPLAIDAPGLPAHAGDQLWRVINSLGVVENKARIVAGTKTLHHLLPDLVMPMDRAWTGMFFQLHPPEWQDPDNQRRTFRRIFGQFADIARRVEPQQYVMGRGWRTSRTKILDNAIIGFCKCEINGRPPAAREVVNEISFEVAGYPPAKNEALSMLGAGHSHAPRVKLLLEAARHACDEQAFVPIDDGHVALDVVVSAPADQPTWDATNYLGGIADVLEDKGPRGGLDHLGDLGVVRLYRNDRQIKDIIYREIESSQAGYTVTVRALGERPAGG